MVDILDACCGGRMFWFNKNHPDVLYMDVEPREKGCIPVRPNFHVSPDVIGDFTNMPFENDRFSLVVFDPPHAIIKKSSIIGLKYGSLGEDWRATLRAGFTECMRVLKPGGFLVFKWNEVRFSVREVLDAIGESPLFGHTTGKSGKTKWMLFRKAED